MGESAMGGSYGMAQWCRVYPNRLISVGTSSILPSVSWEGGGEEMRLPFPVETPLAPVHQKA